MYYKITSYCIVLFFQIKEGSLKNNVQDFHWFKLQGIKSLTALHAPNSKEIDGGEEVLNEAISTLIQSYNEVYNNQVPTK